MEFVENIVESFAGGAGSSNQQQGFVEQRQEYYSGGGQGGPPSVPRPWIAQWAEQERTWIYINEETGERSWEVPYGGGGGGGYYQQQEQQQYYQQESYQQEQSSGDHKFAYGAAGVAAGLALGYEGEKLHNEWDGEKNRLENDVVDFPENAAEWTGNKIGEAEYEVDKVKYDVEDAPENIAGWIGDKVGGVERFGDEISGAYDAGRADGRDGW